MQSTSKCHSFSSGFVLVTVDTVWTDECSKKGTCLYAYLSFVLVLMNVVKHIIKTCE